MKAFDQARLVLQCLVDGDSPDDISLKFDGDKQLVQMWMVFLRHNHIISVDARGRFFPTNKIELLRKADK